MGPLSASELTRLEALLKEIAEQLGAELPVAASPRMAELQRQLEQVRLTRLVLTDTAYFEPEQSFRDVRALIALGMYRWLKRQEQLDDLSGIAGLALQDLVAEALWPLVVVDYPPYRWSYFIARIGSSRLVPIILRAYQRYHSRGGRAPAAVADIRQEFAAALLQPECLPGIQQICLDMADPQLGGAALINLDLNLGGRRINSKAALLALLASAATFVAQAVVSGIIGNRADRLLDTVFDRAGELIEAIIPDVDATSAPDDPAGGGGDSPPSSAPAPDDPAGNGGASLPSSAPDQLNRHMIDELISLLRGQNYQQAIVRSSEMLKARPSGRAQELIRAEARYYRGVAYAATGRHHDAAADFTALIDASLLLYEAYTSRGTVMFRLGRLHSALADLNQAIRIDPKRGEAFNQRGLIYQQWGKQRLAEQDFERARQLGVYTMANNIGLPNL